MSETPTGPEADAVLSVPDQVKPSASPLDLVSIITMCIGALGLLAAGIQLFGIVWAFFGWSALLFGIGVAIALRNNDDEIEDEPGVVLVQRGPHPSNVVQPFVRRRMGKARE